MGNGQPYTSEEFWDIYINKKILDSYDEICEFFSHELPNDFMKNYDVIGIVIETSGKHKDAKEFEKTIKFIDIIKEKQPELYQEAFKYFDEFLICYNCFYKKYDIADAAFSNFRKNPTKDFDLYSVASKKLLFYNVNDNICSAAIENLDAVEEHPDLLFGAVLELLKFNTFFILEDVYEDYIKTKNYNHEKFLEQVEKYDWEDTFLNSIDKGLTSELDIDLIKKNFINDRTTTIFVLEGYFLKYMKKRNFSFPLTNIIWDSLFKAHEYQFSNDKNIKYSIDEFFFINIESLTKSINWHKGGFMSYNFDEAFASLWGSVYIYDFLLSSNLITKETYDNFINISKIVKGYIIAEDISRLWEYNFIHTWEKPDGISEVEFVQEEKIFAKTINLKGYSFENLKEELVEELDAIGELKDFIKEAEKKEGGLFKEIEPYIEQKPYIAPEKIKPNSKCPCGSGKKYKKCCLNK